MPIGLAAFGIGIVAQLTIGAPVSLRDAVAEALAHSPALGASIDRTEAAAIDERRVRADFAPNLAPVFRIGTSPDGVTERALGVDLTQRLLTGATLSATVADRRFDPAAVAASTAVATNDLSYTLTVAQPLLRGFGASARASLRQATRGVTGAERLALEHRRDLVVTVAAAYLDALQSARTVTESERALERARQLHRSSTARVTVGLATELDVSRADWLASTAESALLSARDQQADALDRLKRLLGRGLSEPLALTDADLAHPETLLDAFAPPEPAATADDRLAALIAMALTTRADALEAQDRVGDAERAEGVARWNLLPQVNLEVGYSRAGLAPTGYVAPIAYGTSGWRVGITSDYSLNRGGVSANAALAAIGVRAAARARDEVALQIAEDVRRADRDWSRTGAAITLQTKAVAMAERQLRLAEIRYERGLAGNFDVTDAENNLYQANTGLVAAQAAHALAGLTLRRVVGALDPEVWR